MQNNLQGEGQKKSYAVTKLSCYLGYVCQATVNNFLPLLYATFYLSYGLDLWMIALISGLNFVFQLFVDYSSPRIVGKIGFRATAVIAHVFVVVGLVLLGILPRVMSSKFWGVLLPVMINALGGGLDEVLVSPIIESVPSKNKSAQMAILHSAYCFGAFLIITVFVLFTLAFGIEKWYVLSLILSVLPLVTTLLFCFCPFPEMETEGETNSTRAGKSKDFFIFALLMFGAGSTEIGISQWASTFAELGLNVVKPFGDLYGAGVFALTMGFARLGYSVLSKKIKLEHLVLYGGIICTIGFAVAGFATYPFLNFLGIMLVGLGVAPLWPATYSIASRRMNGSAKTFSMLAFAGDVGCGAGAYVIGQIANHFSINVGVEVGLIFPISVVVVAIYDILRMHKQK